jgi:DNA adenine methylase
MRECPSAPDRLFSGDTRDPPCPRCPAINPHFPGGKRKLANFVKILLRSNGLLDGEYAEVYAGGAAVALELLFERYVSKVHINDFDPGIYAFWHSAVYETDVLCEMIEGVPVTTDEWEAQRAIHKRLHAGSDVSKLDAALATFFLNRANRSGIISGGVIGGKDQTGKWGINARFNKPELVRRIKKIGRARSRISVTKYDGAIFLQKVATELPERSLTYLDPPYYVKGQQMLYANYYKPDDHQAVADLVGKLETPWMVSYDDVKEIRALYASHSSKEYDIHYSAQDRHRGRDVAVFSVELVVPDVDDPARIKERSLRQLELEVMAA